MGQGLSCNKGVLVYKFILVSENEPVVKGIDKHYTVCAYLAFQHFLGQLIEDFALNGTLDLTGPVLRVLPFVCQILNGFFRSVYRNMLV